MPLIEGKFAHKKLSKGSEVTAADAQAYDALEKSFEAVLQQLDPDQGLDQFRSEYEKVLRAVRRSHDNEKRLGAKCKRLNEELAGASARVAAALRLSEEDQTTIATLRKELEKTWRQIDAAHDKESKLKDQLEDARNTLAELSRQAEDGKEQEAALDDVLKHKQDLMQERENQVNQILALRQEAGQLRQQLRGVESQRDEAEANLEALRSETAAKKAENERDAKKRERMEKEMRDLKSSLDARQVELRNRAAEAQAADNVLRDYEQQIRETQASYLMQLLGLKVTSNRVNKEYNELVNQGNRMLRDLDAQTEANARLTADCAARTAALKTSEAAVTAARAENARLARAGDSAAAKLRTSEEKRSQLEAARDQLKARVLALERERDSLQRSLTLQESKIAAMVHEQDMLTKMRVQAEANTHHQLDLSKVHEGHQRLLEAEIAALKQAAEQAAAEQAALVRDNESLSQQAHALQGKLANAQEQLLLREKDMAEVQAEIEEREAVVASQQKSYEAVRAERNRYSRDLIAAQAEVTEARRKFQRVSQQVEQLRDDVRAKESALMKEHFQHSKAEAERQTLATEVAVVEKAVATGESSAKAQRAELHRLTAIVGEADKERARQRKEYEAIMADRDVLGTQLIRRNDEVALLYAKLKLQASALQAGQLAYRDRLAEQRLLRTRIATLQRRLTAARREGADVKELKRQLGALGKRLLQERSKAKALAEELETPLNVHRWRKLEGSDPTAYELIQKVHLLQRRLIEKAEQLVERDLQIREKEQLCRQLQALTQRLPGPDAAQQLAEAQASYREKVKQLKAVKGELQMRHAQVDDYKLSIRRMEAEIAALKGHFFLEKRLYRDTLRSGSSELSSGGLSGTVIEDIWEVPAQPLAITAS